MAVMGQLVLGVMPAGDSRLDRHAARTRRQPAGGREGQERESRGGVSHDRKV
jgi:hypothetical protein